MKTIIKLNSQKYLNTREAVASGIMSKRTARKLLGNSKGENVIKYGSDHLIDISSLSNQMQNRLASSLTTEDVIEKDEPDNVQEIEFVLTFAYHSDCIWKRNIPKFDAIYLREEEKVLLAKTHSFISSIHGLSEEGYLLKQIFIAYTNLKKEITLSNFECGSYDYFTKKLKELKDDGIEKGIINSKRGLARLAKKFTPMHRKYANKFYADPQRFKYGKIKELVNHEVIKLGLKPVGLSTIKMYLSQPEIQNTYKPFRLGRKWAIDKLYPYLIREKPKKTNYQWQSDSTCLNFYVFNDEGKPSRRWICIVIDVKSRKILAFRIAKHETAELVVATLMDAVYTYRVIPFEISHDNSSANISNRMKEIESRMESLGSYVRLSLVGNAQDHGCIERTWGLLQQNYWRSEVGYLGDGVRSFIEEGRVDPKDINDYFTEKKPGIWHEKDLNEMIHRTISNYNDAII